MQQRRWCSATTWSPCSLAPTSSSTPSSSAPREAALASGSVDRAADALQLGCRSAAARGPLRAVEPGAARGPAGTAPGPAAADRPVGGSPGGGCRRRAGPPGDRSQPCRPGRPPGSAEAAGAPGPGPSQGAGHRPQRGRAGAAQRGADGTVGGRSSPGQCEAWHEAGRSPRRRRPGPGPPGPGRRGTGKHSDRDGPTRGGQVRSPGDGHRPGRAARMADRARYGLRRRGAVAVRAGAGGPG